MSWQEHAACTSAVVDPEWFFPPPPAAGQPHPRVFAAQARQVCAGCPVRVACQEYALHEPVQGIWGGLSDDERDVMRRRRGIRLPSGWGSMSRQKRAFVELREVGLSDLSIMRRDHTPLETFLARLKRWGVPKSAEMQQAIDESQRTGIPV